MVRQATIINGRVDWIGLCSVLRPRQHSIGYTGDTQTHNVRYKRLIAVKYQALLMKSTGSLLTVAFQRTDHRE